MAATVAEAKLLAELLRFFRPPKGLGVRFLTPAEFRWEHGALPDWLELADNKAFPESGLLALVHALPSSLKRSAFQLWSSSALNCLELDEAHIDGLRHCVLLEGTELCCLRSEQESLSGIGHTTVFPDIGSAVSQIKGRQILVTARSDLRKAIFINDPEDLWHWWIYPDQMILDLRLNDSAEAYLRAHRQLAALCEILAEQAPLDLSRIQQVHQRQKGSYSFFAEFYDRYMAHVDYSLWITMILTWIRRHTQDQPQKVLELACGTANIAEQLVFKGMEVDACDWSPFMLREASRKAFKPNLFQASMDEPLAREAYYDLVLCLFDSVNYLLDLARLKKSFGYVMKALKPGGFFVFDISTIMNSRVNFDDLVQQHRFGDAMIVHHARFDELSMRQKSSLTLFRKRSLGHVMSEEHHIQRVYRHREIINLISGSGFELVGIFSPDTRANLLPKRAHDIDERYPRLFYMLKRPQ